MVWQHSRSGRKGTFTDLSAPTVRYTAELWEEEAHGQYMENLDAPGCQNCALCSWVCEKAFSSAQGAAHSNHSLRKLLQLLLYLGTANTTWTKPQSTAGWQDSSESFSHHPSDHGEVAQRLSGAQGKDRQTPPDLGAWHGPSWTQKTHFTCYRKWLKAMSEPESPAHWQQGWQARSQGCTENPVCQQRYRLMENLFLWFY